MNRAYKIQDWQAPDGTKRLIFSSPAYKPGVKAFINRDMAMPAEAQAEKLARATPGFISFGMLTPSQWVYIINQAEETHNETT